MQMMRSGPDIEENQRPEMDDRQPIAVDRPFGLLRYEIVHHAEETCGQEKADRIVAIPPLGQRILHPGEGAVAFCAEQADRHRQAIDQMQHCHGQNETEEEPVGDIDMRFRPLDDRADEHRSIADPDDGQPDIDIPFRFGIFLGLGDAQQIAGGRQHDEQLVAPENKTGEAGEGQPRPARALDDVKTRRDQRIASECENDGRSMQRTKPSESSIFEAQIEHRKGQL